MYVWACICWMCGSFVHLSLSQEVFCVESLTVSQRGWSPLFSAACESHWDCLEALIEAKADVNATDDVRISACADVWACLSVRRLGVLSCVLASILF